MANGAPPANGQGAALLGMASQQAEEQRELLAHLQATLKAPARIVRDKVCIVAVGWEGEPPRDYPVILVALPNGERHEYPISQGERTAIVRELAEKVQD